MKRLRIALVIPPPLYGGVGKCLLTYWHHLNHTDQVTDFFLFEAPTDDFRAEVEASGGHVYRLPKNPLALVVSAYRAFRRGRYDIVHANWNLLNVFLLLPAWLAGVPRRVSHAHSASSPRDFRRHCFKLLLRPLSPLFATDFLACSRTAGEFQFGKGAWRSGRVLLLPNALETASFRFNAAARSALRRRWLADGGERAFVIGHIGRLAPPKNQALLIRAFASFSQKHPDAYLMLVGDGADRPLLERLVGQLARGNPAFASHVVFTGAVADANQYYSAFDVFAFPSFYEGLGLAVVEAQANGLKCLVSSGIPPEATLTRQVTVVRSWDESAWLSELEKVADEGAGRTDCPDLGDYDISVAAPLLEAFYVRNRNI